ncbi:MAG: glutamine amidotransferase [Solirubrobacterales bacterium]|nr:glutamine amidotransferase [Solirubrobacterales bacterium]
MKLTIAHLYPTVMSQYGDRGNLVALLQRCHRRGIDTEVLELNLGAVVDGDGVDLLLIGGGADSHQRLISEDLIEIKGPGIRRAVEGGAAGLAICAGYQLFGHYYRTADGTDLPGLGIFDAHTVHRAAEIGARLDTITQAGEVRAVGNLVLRWGDRNLVGFENHGGRTYLHPGAQPLGEVVVGQGNNSQDGHEGCVYRNLIGTYLHGPALPKNPHLVDHLISDALRRHDAGMVLPRLDDQVEWRAHTCALDRTSPGVSRRRVSPRRWPSGGRRAGRASGAPSVPA